MKIRKVAVMVVLAGFIIGLYGCGATQVAYEDEFLVSHGSGVPRPGTSAAQARKYAEDEAKSEAIRYLVDQSKSVVVEGGKTVLDYWTRNPMVRAKIKSACMAAEVLETRYLEDGTVEVDLRVSRQKTISVSSVFLMVNARRPTTETAECPTPTLIFQTCFGPSSGHVNDSEEIPL